MQTQEALNFKEQVQQGIPTELPSFKTLDALSSIRPRAMN